MNNLRRITENLISYNRGTSDEKSYVEFRDWRKYVLEACSITREREREFRQEDRKEGISVSVR